MNARNRLIIEQRASGRTVGSIAAEHGLSPQHVHRIVSEHERRMDVAEKNRRIRELEAEVERLKLRDTASVADEWERERWAYVHSLKPSQRPRNEGWFF